LVLQAVIEKITIQILEVISLLITGKIFAEDIESSEHLYGRKNADAIHEYELCLGLVFEPA
jgi:hypothetical protein